MPILQIDGQPVAAIDDATAAQVREAVARVGQPDRPVQAGFQTKVYMEPRRGSQPAGVTIDLLPLPAT